MILVNGVETGLVQAADRGLSYGDGVFRTLAVRHGVPQHWSRHYAKLCSDCEAISLRCPDAVLLAQEVSRVCAVEPSCALKVVITRGVGERGYRYGEDTVPTRILLTAPLPKYPQTYAEFGVKVRLCRLKLAPQPAMAGVKHLNRLENVLARAEWSNSGIAEGILCDIDDNVIGGTMTNVFVVKNTMLATPSLHRCGIGGLTRDRVIEGAARHRARCEVTTLAWSEVIAADEVFLVNSLIGVWPVRDIEGRTYSVGPLTRAAQNWLKQEDDAQMA
jgi:4-amino-4-deoxychorismate lyase